MGGGGWLLEDNFGTGVQASFLKPTPIIYMVFEKNDIFIYLIELNCLHIHKLFTFFAVCKQSLRINITILVSDLNI